MAEIVNDRDVLIMAAVPRYTPPTDRGMFLTPPAAIFRASADGSTSTPPSFTFKASLFNLAGQVSFAASNGAKLTVNAAANEATLDYAAFLAAGAEAVFVTASITVDGVTHTQQAIVTKVSDGAQGSPGPAGLKNAIARLFQWAPVTPKRPTGTSIFDWPTLSNSGYSANDGWAYPAPANPGIPGWQLFAAAVALSVASTVTTSSISYANAVIENGAQNGATGASGVQSGVATVYRWAATIPEGPAGDALFRWASNAFGEAPAGWAITPGAAPSLGMTLWAASVRLKDTATNGDTAFSWSSASIMAIGYAGTNGGPGQQGASYVTAYIASSAIAANGAPAPTKGRTSLPAPNSSGLAGTYSATVPTLADSQRMYQTDGIYDPATDMVTWSIPYWSSLKVATLSAITANLGAITGGSLNIGNGKFTVDAAGNVTMSSFILFDPNTGKAILQAGGVVNPDFLPASVKNSELVPSIQAAATTANWNNGLTGKPADSDLLNSAIQVGGRNLAEDSAFEQRLRPWTVQAGGAYNAHIETGSDGRKNLVFESNNGDSYVEGQGPWILVVPGKQYMLSFEYANAGAISASSSYIYFNNGGGQGLFLDPLNTGGTRVRRSQPWTCPAGVTGITFRFGFWCTGYAWMRVYNFDLQEGNKPAPWSPAPEDLRAASDAAKALADTVKARTDSISANNVLDRSEKPDVIRDWQVIDAEHTRFINQANALGVPYAEWEARFYELSGYLTGIDYANLNTDSPIDRSTYNARFNNYYDARTALINAFASKNKALADAAQGTANTVERRGTGRPNLLEQNTLPTSTAAFSTDFKGLNGEGPFIARGTDNFAVYAKDRRGCIWVHAFNSPAAGTTVDIYRNDRVKIAPGQRYEFGVTLSTHRTLARAALAWYNAAGNYIGEIGGNDVTNSFWNVGSEGSPPRSVGVVTPPADARSAMLFVRQVHYGDADPYTFASQWYVAEALPGQTEPSPYAASVLEARDMAESAQAGLADKLSQTAGGVLQGQVTLQTSGAIVAGNASWGSAGYGGTGTVQSPYGFACVQNGVPRLAMSVSGDIFYSGELRGAYGTFNVVRVSGALVNGGFTEQYVWAPKGQGGFHLSGSGFIMGDYYNKKWFQITWDGNVYSERFRIVDGQVVMDGPTINSPNLGGKSVSGLYDSRGAEGLPNNTTQTIGSYSVTMNGAVGAATALFSFQTDSGKVTLSVSGNSVVVYGRASNSRCQGTLFVTMTDSNGMSATGSCYIDAGFGSGVPA